MTRRALIVNDVRVVREMLAVQLRDCGFAEQDFAADGVEAVASSSAELASFMRSDMDKWGRVIKTAGIRPD